MERVRHRGEHISVALWRIAVLLGLGITASSACAASRLSLVASPAFLGGDLSSGLSIEVENTGQDAHGEVTINAGGGTTVYPIELPRGARKRFIGYAMNNVMNAYAPVSCDLTTDRGDVHVDVPYGYFGQQPVALEITDDFGGLQFLNARESPQRVQAQRTSVYVKPDDAPGRLLAYRLLPAVVLGPGSERISDDAIHALSDYVLGGGRLVFVGGAVAGPFHDLRWADLLPLTNPHTETRRLQLAAAGQRFGGSVDVQAGTPHPGATTLPGGVTVRPYGLGLIIAFPFDILQGSIKEWPERESYFEGMIGSETGRGLVWPELQPGGQLGMAYGSMTPGAYGGPPAMSMGRPRSGDDPFSFKPPRPESVGLVIVCYIILVAPVNFLILRKLRRSELAWFTTPCISILFAGFLLKLAAGLYFGKMMTTAQGTLLVAESNASGIFRGESQMFFPTGGTFDLKLSNVDWLASNQWMGYRPGGTQGVDLKILDTGQMEVPDLDVRNLQFKEVGFEQIVDTRGWFTFAVKRSGQDVNVTVTNRSPYTVVNSQLFAEGGVAPVLELTPGKSQTVTIPAVPVSERSIGSLISYSGAIHRPILQGRLDGFRPGPQVGGLVQARTQIQLVAVGAAPTGGSR